MGLYEGEKVWGQTYATITVKIHSHTRTYTYIVLLFPCHARTHAHTDIVNEPSPLFKDDL